MSFSPLPRIFLDRLESLNARRGLVLDLGAGGGEFTRILRAAGAAVCGLDRRSPGSGSGPFVVGDVHVPPIRPVSCDLVVAANLVRHLVGAGSFSDFPGPWAELLRPGGAIFVFEDEPAPEPGPAANYRDLQRFLSRLDPAGRGPLLPRADFVTGLRGAGADRGWRFGSQRNECPVNEEAVLRLLRGSGNEPGGEPGRLVQAIRDQGITYGDYWWGCWSPESTEKENLV